MGNSVGSQGGDPEKREMFNIGNSTGKYFYNTVFLAFFNLDIFNTTVRNYVYSFIDLEIMKFIESGENPYRYRFIYKFDYKYYDFILLGYYILYRHAMLDGNVEERYVTPLIVYIKALGCKYFPNEFNPEGFDDDFDPMAIDELNDDFGDYYFEHCIINTENYGINIIKVLLNFFNIAAKELLDEKKNIIL